MTETEPTEGATGSTVPVLRPLTYAEVQGMLRVAVQAHLRARGYHRLRVKPERIGQREVECPCCTGSGWFGCVRELVVCPVCLGFRDVPLGMARWYEDNAARIRAGMQPIRGLPEWVRPPSVWETRGPVRCSIEHREEPGIEADLVYSDLTV